MIIADKYIVSDKIDLKGRKITLPNNCQLVLRRKGCFANGTIEGNNVELKCSGSRIYFCRDVSLVGHNWKAALAYSEWFDAHPDCTLHNDGSFVDGTDNYQSFQNLLKFNNVQIKEGVYFVDGNLQTLRSNQTIEGNGAVIKGQLKNRFAGILTVGSHFPTNEKTENVLIANLVLIGVKNEATMETQWAHGVVVKNANNVKLSRITCMLCKGDGFNIAETYLEGQMTHPSNVELVDCVAESNYRCGLSITGGSSIKIVNSVFNNAKGQDPQAGIDVEPNVYKNEDGSLLTSECEDIYIDNCVFNNNHKHAVKLESPSVCDELGSFPIRKIVISLCAMNNNGVSIWRVDSLDIKQCSIVSNIETNGIVFQNEIQRNVTLDDIYIYNSSEGKPVADGVYFSPGHTRNNVSLSNIRIKGNYKYGLFIPSDEKYKGTITQVSFRNISIGNAWHGFFVGNLVGDASYTNIETSELGTTEEGRKMDGRTWGWSVHKHND